MWNKPGLPFSHPDWMSRHFSSNSLADQLCNPSGLWISCECFFQVKQNSLFSSSLVKIRAFLTTRTVLLILEWHLGHTLLPLYGGMWGSHHAHTHRTTYTLSATSRSKHLCSTKYMHVVQVCVCDSVHSGCEFEVMPGLHIRYGPNQTGRLVFEVAFVVPDRTDSNTGNAQGVTVNKLLKIFLCSR